ncbi:unnamed protein product [Brachionus calyciflorus]|uniref:Actin maturation protease n=1 Tax=Brachionus calyciflorus TaxID=104777 RepID=A0A814A4G9_9BILA|nr:unnamed protein product [Brachionus calyciflorus]
MDDLLGMRIYDLISRTDFSDNKWFVTYQNVESVYQSGPQCGIVALCMALNNLKIKCSVDELMKDAREQSFTKSGEIFNIDFLHNLALKYYPKCSIHTMSDDDSKICEKLIENKLILIAYDCDLNFEPCNKNGLRAHWALLTGILFPIDSNETEYFQDFLKEDSNLILPHNDLTQAQRDILKFNSTKKNIYAICRQGKSKHYGLWDLNRLIESNKQLKLIDHVKCNDENFVKPKDGDLQKTLAFKFLVFE